ncbi:SpoIIIAH-like family protein [Brassicibacter mesophilus]|uniref:SpoIIIAH-like family protein n=1 Tax=Brassicibacter mesophilus TaxID=745119 RepID=UPI003D1E9A36
MILKKKTVLIISLICLLVVVGYLNHQLTKKSLLQSSNEYQQHEEDQLMKINSLVDDSIVETVSENLSEVELDDIPVVDSRDSMIDDLKTDTDDDIEETITKEENMRSSNYFIEYRLSRDKLRASLIERLNEIVNNEKTNEDMRTNAQNEIISIGQIAETELYVEGLVKAKGFEDALVFLKNDSARVVVSVKELSEQDVMKILEIVKSETSIDPSNIKIMKKF